MTRKNYLTKVMLAMLLSLGITALLMIPAIAADSGRQDKEPYRIESFEFDGPGDLSVRTTGGHITVKATKNKTVRVEMYVRHKGEFLTSRDTDLSEWSIDIRQKGNSVEALAKRKDNDWNIFGDNRPSVSFVIYTPREMSTDLKTSGGHIQATGLTGQQEISTSGGHLKLTDLEGTVEAKTSGGHVNLHNIRGDTHAKTSGGHISAKEVDGNLRVKTSGGHINLSNISGSIDANTSGGNITADLSTIGSHVNLKTSGGNVSLSVPEQIGLDLHLRGSYVDARLNNFSGEIDRSEIAGSLNGGGPSISARTSGGVVSLSFQ